MCFPDLLVKVRRHASISLTFLDEQGALQEWERLGRAESELLQHELDHLDGVLATDLALDARSIIYRTAFDADPAFFQKPGGLRHPAHDLSEAVDDGSHLRSRARRLAAPPAQIPETGFDECKTADFVAEKLAAFGLEVTRGLGGTGVVGTLRGARASAPSDCGPTWMPWPSGDRHPAYASQHAGRMHACGHDGHMAILLGAARLLAQAEDLDGTVHFVFQPAEEHGRGAKAMIADGLLDALPHGRDLRPAQHAGPARKATSRRGRAASWPPRTTSSSASWVAGAHAARPHMSIDPIVIGAEIVLALQTIVSRNLDPTEQAVVSVTEFVTDGTRNVIPGSVTLKGDTRSYSPEVQALLEDRMAALVAGICAAHGAEPRASNTPMSSSPR